MRSRARGTRPAWLATRTAGALAAGALALAVTTAIAVAQQPGSVKETHDEFERTIQADPTIPDTDTTPKYGADKDASKQWVQRHGALFKNAPDPAKATETVTDLTSYDDNLFAVDFRNEERGLVAGARCADPNPDAEKDCRPIAFLFRLDPDFGATWTRLDLPGADRPGYIADIAWMDANRALLVGGTGVYPRREPRYQPACNDPSEPLEPWNFKCDPAGKARVWIYNRGAICELRVGEGDACPSLPAEMRGLTTVDVREATAESPELGFVGGLGQIFRWVEGGFDKRYDNRSAPIDLEQPTASRPARSGLTLEQNQMRRIFRFRVRDIRFAPVSSVHAFAVTSGCCTPDDWSDRPNFLGYTETPSPGWTMTSPSDDRRERVEAWNNAGRDEGTTVGFGNTVPPITLPTPRVDSLRERGIVIDLPPTKTDPHQSGREYPDSLYSLTTAAPVNKIITPRASVLFTTASDDSALETRSQIRKCTATGARVGSAAPDTISPLRGAARLVAIDGETPSDLTCGSGDGGPVGPDWAVGELRTSVVPGRGRRGLVLSAETPERRRKPPYYDPPSAERPQDFGPYAQRPTDEQRVRAHFAARDQVVSSYSLNSLDMVLDTGSGWAVGDHGAILELDNSEARAAAVAKAEPEPARLDVGRTSDLPPTDPYDSARPPPAADPEGVPPLALRPVDRLLEPILVGMGSPDANLRPENSTQTEDVGEIIMNRDGTDGWAIGTNPRLAQTATSTEITTYGVLSLYRFDGSSWRRCDPVGVRGQIDANPECKAAAPLRRFVTGSPPTPKSATLVTGARIPYERDDEPDNDDDFEVMAIGTDYADPVTKRELPVVLRLKHGRWEVDRSLQPLMEGIKSHPRHFGRSLELRDIAFTAPDDGWILASIDGFVPLASGRKNLDLWLLLHWNGKEWSVCSRDAGGCSGERVPFTTEEGAVQTLVTAGDRVYLYGFRRGLGEENPLPLVTPPTPLYPFIIYRDRKRGVWTDGSGPEEDGGGYDPAFGKQTGDVGEQGKVMSLSVAQRPDGTFTGWAVGYFFSYESPPDRTCCTGGTEHGQHQDSYSKILEPTTILMRLEPDEGGRLRWRYFKDRGALYDLMTPMPPTQSARLQTEPGLQLTLTSEDGGEEAYIAQRDHGNLFRFNRERKRWDLVRSGRPRTSKFFGSGPHGDYQALAPDGRGGFWAAIKTSTEGQSNNGWSGGGQVWFYRHTGRPPRPVFREVPHPFPGLPDAITTLTAAPDGSVWLGTDQGRVARYDRVTGWSTALIEGWDPGRVVTRRSEIRGLAVDPQGHGLVVGPRGRVATVTPTRVGIDAAAGRRCGSVPEPPCGTGFDLHAVAVAPDGSALAGGSALTVLYRPLGGAFLRIEGPKGNPGNRITAISMPEPNRAWLVSDGGYVYAGSLADGVWQWRRENRNEDGDTVGRDGLPLRAVALDDDGEGYAVGDRGMVLERTGDGAAPWRRVRPPGTDDLLSITVAGDADRTMIGGRGGLILTRVGDELVVARPADYAPAPAGQRDLPGLDTLVGPVVGLALVPGVEDGQAEAWAAIQARGAGTNRLLHYSSDPDETLLQPDRRAQPLPDAPAPRPGELTIAAFGNMGCDARSMCAVRRRTTDRREVIAERIVDELRDRMARPGAPELTLFTGDTASSAGLPANSTHKSDRIGDPGEMNLNPVTPGTPSIHPHGSADMALSPVAQRMWGRLVADPLEDLGVATFASAGPGDLSRPLYRCDGLGCEAYGEEAKTGENLTWRDTMEARLAPWGKRAEKLSGPLSFAPVPGADDDAHEIPNQKVDYDGDGPVPVAEVKGGARTHYAVDLVRGGERIARLVTVDSSLRSLGASDPIQQPVEKNGQMQWLERMLCREGETAPDGRPCNRPRDLPAIVLTNTPTYSYTPGASITETNAADGIRLESLLLRHEASVAVTGRLNQTGRYWATAPGIHEPCPGQAHQEQPPEPGTRVCGREGGAGPEAPALRHLGAVIRGLGPPPPPVAEAVDTAGGNAGDANVTGVLPFVVAATAGGPFGTSRLQADPQGRDGFFAGYSIVRVPADGDPREVIVEQRAVFDWVTITARGHVLRPGQKLQLRGVGREPIGYNESRYTRFDALDSPAITHRYDLLEADREKPWLPKVVEGNGNPHGYVPLDPAVATVDAQTGRVVAGRGNRGRVYALALLSVGAESATWPLVLEPRRSFTPPAPRKLTIPPALPPIRVLGIPVQAAPSQPPPAPPATPPIAVDLVLPPPPAIPGFPGTTPTPIAPPIPPATPPPPASQGQVATGLAANPLAILLAPTAAPIPPSSPLIQPAPPSGARREARQKQAATAKSEEGAKAADKAGTDLAGSKDTVPGSQAFSRRRADGPAAGTLGFTPRARSSQPSAWVTGLQVGGGTALMALVLALGWTTGRPTPRGRRREDVSPAPAWLRRR